MYLTIRQKILVLGVFCLIALVLVFGSFYYNNLEANKHLSQTVQSLIEREVNTKIELLTQSMAIALGDLIRDIDDEKEQIKLIASAIESFTFEDDKSGYFFAFKRTSNVAHPNRKDLIGSDLVNAQDKDGVFYIRELYQRALEGGGFVAYDFSKPQPGGGVHTSRKNIL